MLRSLRHALRLAGSLCCLALALGACRKPSSTKPVEEWFENDPDHAFAAGRQQKQLVFADLWAPWCHTCLSMREQVLKQAAVPELGHVVRLAVDTELAQNEQFLQRYPVTVWPTFYVIDPETRTVRGRWLGAAPAAELGRWLRSVSATPEGPAELRSRGDAFAAEKRLAEAEAMYQAALTVAPKEWPQRSDTLVAHISALSKQHKYAPCLAFALTHAEELPASVSAVDFASTALGCADKATENADANKVRKLVETTLTRDCATRSPGASADDQADACGNLRRARVAIGDALGARQAAERALSVIAAASAGAPAETQAIYDWERSSSLTYLGRADEAIALLVERERALPKSYNPPHYLARTYRELKQWSLGLSAIERALSKAYGPRRIGLLGVKVDLLKGAGRDDEARRVLEAQLAQYRALPSGQKQPEAENAVETRLREWR